ncbi:MAG: MMPL family transporter, partial [Thermoplasmata archaeon]|nr:MMPL family transporter [Thermoplasmata archaeon]
TALPSSAPSAQAQAEIDRLFPNFSAGSDSLLLVTGPHVTGAVGQASVLAIARAISTDRNLTYLSGVTTLYSSYEGYLAGLTEIALGGIGAGLTSSPTLPSAVNQSASLLWGTPALYVATWQGMVAAHPSSPPASWNYPAYQVTLSDVGANTTAGLVLSSFYSGPSAGSGSSGGFNGSADCAADPSTVLTCSNQVVVTTIGGLLPVLGPNPSQQIVLTDALAGLTITDFANASAQHAVAISVLSGELGLSASWIGSVWTQFTNGSGPPSAVAGWVDGIVTNGSPATYPLPIPTAMLAQFVDGTGTGELVFVGFSVSDSFTAPDGANPVFDDISAIGGLLPVLLATTDPSGSLAVAQTGGAPLDQTEQTVLSSSLAVVLPLTIIVLVGITMAYFRAPLAPAITFGGLGIALALGLGGVVLIGTLISHVDSTALTLQNTFVLGVGTDYSIFLVARYREELWKGAEPAEAVVTTVTWAGQSIAISGATAALATLALAFSGDALLSQWGFVLSVAVLLAVLVSLTIIPAFLALVGPRVFWPFTGERFRQQSIATMAARSEERTYFFRVARRVRRRPRTVVGLVLLASVPLLFVALTAPIAYDFFGQLPLGYGSTNGLATLSEHFGPGRAFPTIALLTFAAPLLVGNTSNAPEFTDLADLTSILNSTQGVASVDSPTGPSGAPLTEWVGFASLKPANQTLLRGTLAGYVGSDQSTVLLTVYSTSGGLSVAAVELLGSLRGEVHSFESTHPDVIGAAFGGGAAETSDIEQQTSLATQRMALAVSVGLVVVLFVVLRSWLIPLMAVLTIGLSIGWAWGVTNLVLTDVFGIPMFYFVPTVLFILILGLGIDYNIFLLTRVREERLRGRSADEATVHGLASTGGIITAAAVILASAFLILTTGQFLLLRSIGFAVATAVLLDAMIVRTYLVPASLFLFGERVWPAPRLRRPKA